MVEVAAVTEIARATVRINTRAVRSRRNKLNASWPALAVLMTRYAGASNMATATNSAGTQRKAGGPNKIGARLPVLKSVRCCEEEIANVGLKNAQVSE